MKPRIGIMQGRLVPRINDRIQAFPASNWQEEFPLANQIGLDSIEFIFDAEDSASIRAHPLLEKDCRLIRTAVERHGVTVQTVCADYFINHPFHSSDAIEAASSLELAIGLLRNCRILGLTDIVIPCVDAGKLATAEDCHQLVKQLAPVVRLCEESAVNLALETDLSPLEFPTLLAEFDSERVTVNYDVGNSASLGFQPAEEWAAYGPKVSSVHIKDRLLHGSTVPLGTGSADFDSFFRAARDHGYCGLFIIQGARGSDDVATARRYKEFVEGKLREFYGVAAG